MIPAALPLLCLALAALRTWQLLANDRILAAPRSRLVGSHWNGDQTLRFDRPRLAEWLACPWCSGAWISLAVYGCWLDEPRWTLYAAAPLAISAAVGLGARLLPD